MVWNEKVFSHQRQGRGMQSSRRAKKQQGRGGRGGGFVEGETPSGGKTIPPHGAVIPVQPVAHVQPAVPDHHQAANGVQFAVIPLGIPIEPNGGQYDDYELTEELMLTVFSQGATLASSRRRERRTLASPPADPALQYPSTLRAELTQ